MQCRVCGSELADNARFCGKCGTKVEPMMSGGSPSAPGAFDDLAGADAVTAGDDQSFAGEGSAAYASGSQTPPPPSAFAYDTPTPPPPPAQSYPSAGYVPARRRGCLGSAWSDITSSPGWVKRVLVLMVMQCVPLLDFFAVGYSMRWGAEAASGRFEPLPKGGFGKREFLLGLFYWILNLLFAVASSWLFVVGLIPFVGAVAVLVVSIFAQAVFALAVMRVALYDRFGQAFELSELLSAFRKDTGSLVGAAFVPALLLAVVVFVLISILLVVAIGSAMASFPGSYHHYYYGADGLEMIAGALLSLGLGLVFLVVVTLFLAGFAELWALRAVGHWVNRNMPEWAKEAAEAKAGNYAGNASQTAS